MKPITAEEARNLTTNSTRSAIDKVVFSPAVSEVCEYEADDGDVIWSIFKSVDGIHDDTLLIPHLFYENGRNQ